jgi:hypothetical protein
MPRLDKTVTVKWDKTPHGGVQLFEGKKRFYTTCKLRRFGFPIDNAICNTDFYAEGMTFGNVPHLLSLNVGPKQGYQRANILVPVSRHSVMSEMHLVAPLWPPHDDTRRRRIVDAFVHMLKPDDDYEHDIDRMWRLHTECEAKHYEELMDKPRPPAFASWHEARQHAGKVLGSNACACSLATCASRLSPHQHTLVAPCSHHTSNTAATADPSSHNTHRANRRVARPRVWGAADIAYVLGLATLTSCRCVCWV